MPTNYARKRAKQITDESFYNAAPGGEIISPDGKKYSVVKIIDPEGFKDSRASWLDRRERRRETARARRARHEQTEGRKALRQSDAYCDAARVRVQRHAAKKSFEHSQWPFCPIDAEGVNVLDEAWCENAEGENIGPHFQEWIATADRAWFDKENKIRARRRQPKLDWNFLNEDTDKEPWQGDTLNPHAQRVWREYVRATGNTLYMPQKLVVIAAGAGETARTLCHAAAGSIGRDAPALGAEETLDFLYDLLLTHQKQFFVMYGSGYDFTEILRGLPAPVAWEIQNQMAYSNKALKPEQRDDPDVDRTVLWVLRGEDGKPRKVFGINYLPRKWFKLWRISSNLPETFWHGWPSAGRRTHVPYDHGAQLKIHDTVSFYQCSFIEAMDGMNSSIEVSAEDRALIEWGKPKRGVFVDEPMNKIIAYNQAELNVLAKMMDAFREALGKIGVDLKVWYGPGAVAKAKLESEGILPEKKGKRLISEGHFPPKKILNTKKAPEAQRWSMHAFSGGCIDLVRQGVSQDENLSVHQYDVTSAYPSVIARLPSMRDCSYKKIKSPPKTLAELKSFVEASNMLSMFDISWSFKKETEVGESLPFNPLFYRTNGKNSEGFLNIDGAAKSGIKDNPETIANARNNSAGRILYPSYGRGRYFQEEVLAAIAWCEHYPWAVNKFVCNAAMIFVPHESVKDARPLVFVQDLFNERARIVAETNAAIKVWEATGKIGPKPYNLLEKAIKLVLNSIYGKMAQSLGNPGKLPKASNPFYAGAITAGTRAMLHIAALKDPDRVIAFATDAIFSAGPMRGLETTPEKILGTWEFAAESDTSEAAVFLHPGINSFLPLKGKEHTKKRGCKIEFGRDFLIKNVVDAWKKGIPVLPVENTSLMTLGLALNAEKNWPKCGVWKTAPREIALNKAGVKRGWCDDKARASRLVLVPPKENLEHYDQLSMAYVPQWLVDESLVEQNLENEGAQEYALHLDAGSLDDDAIDI